MILVVDVVDDNVESLECSPLMKYKTISQASKKKRSMNWGWGLWIGEHHDILRRRIFEETIFPKKERWITSKAQEEYFKWKKPFLLYSFHLSLSLSEHLFIAISRQGWSGLSEPFHFRTAGPGDYRSDDLRFWVTKKGWIVGLADSEIINKMFVL